MFLEPLPLKARLPAEPRPPTFTVPGAGLELPAAPLTNRRDRGARRGRRVGPARAAIQLVRLRLRERPSTPLARLLTGKHPHPGRPRRARMRLTRPPTAAVSRLGRAAGAVQPRPSPPIRLKRVRAAIGRTHSHGHQSLEGLTPASAASSRACRWLTVRRLHAGCSGHRVPNDPRSSGSTWPRSHERGLIGTSGVEQLGRQQ